jgi:hypothetical protein
MATVRQGPTVGVQLNSSFPIANYGILGADGEAQTWATIGQAAQTGFDMVKRDFDQDAVRQAQIDAPQLIQKDGQGLTVPVSSFEPPGITSRAYRDAYKSFGINAYSTSVAQDHENFLTQVQARHPADIDAAQKAMEERRNQVVAGLDPEVAPLITLKINAMNGQVASRINANVQAQANKVAEEKGMWAYNDVVTQASRLSTTPGEKFDIETVAAANSQIRLDMEKTTELLKAAGYPEVKIKQMWDRAYVEVETVRDERMYRAAFANKDQLFAPGEFETFLLEARKDVLARAEKFGPDGQGYLSRMMAAIDFGSQTGQLQLQRQDATVLDAQRKKDFELRQQLETGDAFGISKADVMRQAEDYRNSIYTDPSLSTAQKVRGLGMADQAMGRVRADISEYANRSVLSLASEATSVETTPERRTAVVQELKQFGSDPMIAGYVPTAARNYAQRVVSQIATDSAKTNVAQTMADSQQGNISPDDIRKWGAENPNLIGEGALINPKQWRDAIINNDMAYARKMRTMSAADRVLQRAKEGVRSSAADWEEAKGATALAFNRPYNPASPESRADAAAYLRQTMEFPEASKSAIKNIQYGGDPSYTNALVSQMQDFKTVLKNKRGYNEKAALGLMREELGKDSMDFLSLAASYGPEKAATKMLDRTNAKGRNQGANTSEAAAGIEATVDTVFRSMTDKPQGTYLGLSDPSKPEDAWALRMLDQNSGKYQKISVISDLRQVIASDALTMTGNDGQIMDVAYPNTGADEIAIRQFTEKYRDRMELVANPNDKTEGIWQWKSANTKLSEMIRGPVSENMRKGAALGFYDAEQRFLKDMGVETINDNFDRKSVDLVQSRSEDGSLSWNIVAMLPNSIGPTILKSFSQDDPQFSAFMGDVLNQAQKDLETHWIGSTPKPDDRSSGWFGASVAGELYYGAGDLLDKVGDPIGAAFNWLSETKGFPLKPRPLFADYKRRQYLEQRFDQLGNPKASDRGMVSGLLDRILGRDPGDLPNLHSAIDLKETRKAFEASRDEDLHRRLRDFDYLRTLDARTKIK